MLWYKKLKMLLVQNKPHYCLKPKSPIANVSALFVHHLWCPCAPFATRNKPKLDFYYTNNKLIIISSNF